ncbi:PAS domain-containing protein [uncultured Enterovirga sp.]|uniref:PAS domain-containing protein n=1 Tax=uncultured Enterovirga sp. TaxID=2026352 RepID=UPI0035CBD767
MRGDVTFLTGGGEMGELMRSHPWSETLIGSESRWPQPVVTLVRVMLGSRQPMFIAWGPERVLLYNDAYAPLLGARHPAALGRPFFEVWPEIGDEVRPLMDRVFAGDPVHMDDLQLTLHRHGVPEEAHFAFSYTPVPGETGTIDGLFCACSETTGQVLAERGLAAERWTLRQLFGQAHGFMATMRGPLHVFEYTNPAYMQLVGHRDVVGKPVREALPEVAGQGFFELLDEVYATGTVFRGKALQVGLQRTPGGPVEDRYIDLVYQPVTGSAGEVTGIFAEGHDVTEMHVTQIALQESEEFNRRVLASSDDCIKVLDLDSRLTFMSEGGQRVMEVSDFNAIQGCPWPDFWQDQGNRDAKAAVAAARAGRPAQFQGHATTMAGTPRFWDVRVTPILDKHGRPEKILSISRDITATWEAEEALRGLNESLERQVLERTAERNLLASVVETTDMMFLAADLDHTILGINKANADEFERIYGVRPKAGDNLLALLADQPDHQAQVRAGWARGLSGEDLTIVEDYGDPDRSRPYYEIKFRALRNAGGDRIGCYQFVTDVTERLRSQAELVQAQEALRQAQKMEAVGQLTGGLAHDFNNLLAGISGSLELMQTRMKQGRFHDVERYMTAAEGAARRAAALTHRLLAFSRRQTLDPKPTNVNRLVTGMQELIQRTVGPSISFEFVGVSGLWPALVDPPQLENALLNLCINARDAMPDGGRITVETANKWMDDRAASHHDMPPGQYLSLCVTDTGTGMTPAVIARVFEPFFTTKPIGEGTGLGLSMIYGFAKQSGGQVRIYSEVGQGTTVCLYLPRHYGEIDTDDGASKPPALPRSEQGETVLVVDDEPTVRMLVADILEDLGYRALEAPDSAAGLKLLQSDVRIDLLVTDVGLPGGMNGRQMADAARLARPDLKVLFITGYAENSVLGNGHLAPGMAVLTKPFPVEAMASRIRQMIEM